MFQMFRKSLRDNARFHRTSIIYQARASLYLHKRITVKAIKTDLTISTEYGNRQLNQINYFDKFTSANSQSEGENQKEKHEECQYFVERGITFKEMNIQEINESIEYGTKILNTYVQNSSVTDLCRNTHNISPEILNVPSTEKTKTIKSSIYFSTESNIGETQDLKYKEFSSELYLQNVTSRNDQIRSNEMIENNRSSTKDEDQEKVTFDTKAKVDSQKANVSEINESKQVNKHDSTNIKMKHSRSRSIIPKLSCSVQKAKEKNISSEIKHIRTSTKTLNKKFQESEICTKPELSDEATRTVQVSSSTFHNSASLRSKSNIPIYKKGIVNDRKSSKLIKLPRLTQSTADISKEIVSTENAAKNTVTLRKITNRTDLAKEPPKEKLGRDTSANSECIKLNNEHKLPNKKLLKQSSIPVMIAKSDKPTTVRKLETEHSLSKFKQNNTEKSKEVCDILLKQDDKSRKGSSSDQLIKSWNMTNRKFGFLTERVYKEDGFSRIFDEKVLQNDE